ncbi:BREX-2 system phosphatase PglZ [Kibdelosporangium aridum]|uniref:BREX-2 system phosphatase PglZ n=1 Tax=Kibdelosporangium aridum TaxID=2030 RepID=A0A428Z239_KIBAR|nr:BREX-2 system phosphatase PglZ [Kibdelosporangium aridum]RSM79385.1 BREX-2 system phosphatase PglZ [Kibdelosporangium aridum]
MAIADLGAAFEGAVIARARAILAKVPRDTAGPVAIGIAAPGLAIWTGADHLEAEGREARIVACPSVLAVLAALAGEGAETDHVTGDLVVLTDRSQDELGEAIMSRLHGNQLYDVSRDTLLNDVLQPKQVDVRLRERRRAWLTDALIELAQAGEANSLHGTVLTLELAITRVLRERLGLDLDELDLVEVIALADDSRRRARWRALPPTHRQGMIDWLVERLGEPAGLVMRLAEGRDDVLADLLVADVLTATAADPELAALFGGFAGVRWGSPLPPATHVRAAADSAVALARSASTDRVAQQVRRADSVLADLGGRRFAAHSDVLPSGFEQRLRHAVDAVDEADLDPLYRHRDGRDQAAIVRRVEAAVRVRRWLDIPTSEHEYASVSDWMTGYARDLAWLDRELTQLRQGAPWPEVAAVFGRLIRSASQRRRSLDLAFSRILPSAAGQTPRTLLAVETVLPTVVADLASTRKVLLVVVDGMSMPVAVELAESVVGSGDNGWTEVVRPVDGGREAVLAAFPTETSYSRTSLLTASLRRGDAGVERSAFGSHPFWPARTRAQLVHKDGLAGRDGGDLGAELTEAFTASNNKHVVAVVLNAVDESLPTSRQADDPTWHYRDVSGLPELLERAALDGWIVVLTSDHGHVLEHDSTHRPDSTGGARWRMPGERPLGEDEVLLRGPRVLVPGNEVVLAATEDIRYGRRTRGYHGGASLAEVAIPLIVLLPPGSPELAGWTFHSLGPPDWWTGRTVAGPVVSASTPTRHSKPDRRRRRPVKSDIADAPTLFSEPEPDAASSASIGRALISSATFVAAHKAFPRNRVPDPDTVANVVDVLVAAGGRSPVAAVLQAAGAPGRNPRALVGALKKLLNFDQFPVIDLVDNDRTVVLNRTLLEEQFLDEGSR